ncbi:MAG: alkaline phosphatase family protein [Bacteroidales bacterium]|jgi:predicted AlkP superfamily pyrophosphatase or phosphodiesterase|nr:alkaline phosphatase family protein [Bacteroidales bacterium]
MKIRTVFFLLLCVAVRGNFAQAQQFPDKPKLIVTVVIEGMRYDYLQQFEPQMCRGGFKKLMTQGAQCTNAHHNAAFLHNATGTANIATGTTASEHGIVNNWWYSRLYKSKVNCVNDYSQNSVGCPNKKSVQVSPQYLMASTFGEELYKSSKGKSKVFSIALQPYAAVLAAGKKATGVFFLDEFTGNWITSSYYAETLPSWLGAFNAKKTGFQHINREWTPLFSIDTYKESWADDSEYEIGMNTQRTFPYNITYMGDTHKPFRILKHIPYGNTYTKELAMELIEKEQLGKRAETDYLHITYTAAQEVAYKFGNLSKEIEDTYIRLDYELMSLIGYLEQHVGKENFVLVLTSNHGMAEPSKFTLLAHKDGGIFKYVENMYLLDKYLDTRYGEDEWVEHYANQQIYLNAKAMERRTASISDIQRSAANFIGQLSGVHTVLTASDLAKSNYSGVQLSSKMSNAFYAPRSGDILFQLKPHWNEQSTDVVAHHLSGYNYDTHVPLLCYGWKIKPTTITKAQSVANIAPTLSRLARCPVPNMARGEEIDLEL